VRRSWLREAEKFFPTSFLVGLELDKRKGATDLSGASIVSVNYEGLAKWSEDIIAGQFDLLVCDESHMLKNPDSIRTQLVTELSKHFQFKILLSGTAIKNNRDELNPQLTILDPELYGSDCSLFKTPTGYFWHAIQAIYMAMPKTEVLPFLPKKTVARHDQSVNDPVDLPSSIEEIMLFKHKCAMSKLDITCEKIKDILENSDDAILVFSEFVNICQEIHRRFKKESLYHDGQMSNEKREAVKELFQRDDCAHRVFVSTRPSLAVGATLTRASHVVFNDLPWCPADIDQAADRVHRIGQHKPVSVYWIIAENSAFDMRLIDLISQKYAIQKAVTEGKQLTKEEQEFLATPISFRQLLKGAKE
jgi:SWI/SNF-related matrix-associated actin-dependent regulator 1 of chromatin subfamily A